MFLILGDTVTELPVNEVVEFADVEPDAVGHMIATGLIVDSGRDAALLHPGLFTSEVGAQKAIQRAYLDIAAGTRRTQRCWTFPYKTSLIRRCPAPLLMMARYQTLGVGQRPRLGISTWPVIRTRGPRLRGLGLVVGFEGASGAGASGGRGRRVMVPRPTRGGLVALGRRAELIWLGPERSGLSVGLLDHDQKLRQDFSGFPVLNWERGVFDRMPRT